MIFAVFYLKKTKLTPKSDANGNNLTPPPDKSDSGQFGNSPWEKINLETFFKNVKHV